MSRCRGTGLAIAATMADKNTPNQNANKSKAEGDRDEAGGITNRSLEEERQEQAELPARGATREESRNLGVGDEVEADREERRSER